MPVSEFPQFESWVSAKYDRPGGPFDPHTGDYYVALPDRGRVLQAPDADDRRARGRREPVVLDLVQHGGRLGLHVRRGPHAGSGRLDDAARRHRAHEPEHGGDSCTDGEGWQYAASVPRPLPDVRRRRQLHADRDAPGTWNAASRSLRRLGAVVDRPGGLRRRAGRGVDRLRQRLVRPGPRRVHRRRDRADRHDHVVRDGPRWLGGHRAARRAAPRTPTTSIGSREPGFPEGAAVATDDIDPDGLRNRGHHRPGQDRNAVVGRTMQYLLR